MKSLAIKTNKNEIIDYLLKKLEETKFNETFYYTRKKFKIYNNLIIHYKGNENLSYCNFIANILTQMVLENYEENIIKNIININYFYFEPIEKHEILRNTTKLLGMKDIIEDGEELFKGYKKKQKGNEENEEYQNRKEKLQFAFYKYIKENKSIVLEGFINFRIKEYMKILDSAVDYSVNKYIVDREYTEFITLLKLYINSEKSNIDFIHLIYYNKQSIITDKNMQVLDVETDIFNAKYLSDITFSSNDYVLNTILNLLPQKICIHLIDEEDEFIETVKLIFDQKVEICKDCSICRTWEILGKDLNKDLGMAPKSSLVQPNK